ncbi:MAG: baseplate J/gp47 family protein [Myxococcota bacterium]|nr:baseplate J/gp47 family protein [Myxococcota bacterium]
MITIEDLLTAPTSDEVLNRFVTNLVAMKIPADKWRPAGVGRTILRVVASTYAGGWQIVAAAIAGGFLTEATGPWLVLLARYVYGVEARPATFATGSVTLTNTAGGIYTYGAGEVTVLDSSSKKSFTNTAPFTLGAGSVGAPTTLSIPIQAVEVGATSSAAPGEIDTLVTAMLGVTVSNPVSVAGLDAQSDDDLRALCLSKLGSLSVRGPRTAYDYAIKTATRPDGSPVGINRSSISTGSHTGRVSIYVAMPSGAPSLDDLTAVGVSIDAKARPDVVTVNLYGAIPVNYSPALTVWALAIPGLVESDVKAKAKALLRSFIESYPIGGLSTIRGRGLFASGVDGVVKSAHEAIFAVDGATDLPLLPGQVAVDSTSITVRMVATMASD